MMRRRHWWQWVTRSGPWQAVILLICLAIATLFMLSGLWVHGF
jgi:hypothetical protein